MENTQELQSPEVMSKQLLDAILNAQDGTLKNASEASTNMIRRRLRENGYSRLILPPKQVSDADLSRLPDTELPVIVEDMEPDSVGAKAIPFNDTPETAFFRGDKFVVYFATISTPEFTKNVYELKTYKMNLREVVTDNALKDVQTAEDARWTKTVDRIVGAVGGNGEAGVPQNFEINAAITRASYPQVLNYLEDRNLNNGAFLMNRKTAKTFLGFNRTEIGGDLSEAMFQDGLTALQQAKIFGVRHIFTIKRDQVPDNVIYQYAEPSYLGRYYILQDVTMYVEKKKDILKFSAQEKIGLTFANVSALNRVKFLQ